ncbi:MAG: sulfatase-like hydrolase/transferase [Saprospiraceae bacterium]|nr:sulfatase-like hydrolase/transferase [Saprospiraceae bacterium]
MVLFQHDILKGNRAQEISLGSIAMLLAISLLIACGNVSEGSTALSREQQPPNILVIMTDDQGYHDVSYYGTTDLSTPAINALAADGMRFDYFYANCPVCSPTRASLMTGRYPDRVGVPGVIRTYPEDNWGYLDPNAPTLPGLLGDLGYETALIGKWHLGLESPNTPNERGFDYFYGWLGDMMDDYWEKRRHGFNYMRINEDSIDPDGHATDLFTEAAVKYLEKRSPDGKPFFLFLSYNAPHFPVQPPPDWLEKVQARDPSLSEKRAKLIAFIEHMDDGIGQVIQSLKRKNLYDNTLIIFTSDNGGLLRDEANNGPLRDGKQSMYEGGLRVPTCAVWKDGGIQPGSVSYYKAITMDIVPTLVEAAGGEISHEIDGRSFFDVLMGEEVAGSDRSLYFVRREGGTRYAGLTIQAVQYEGWKLLQNSPFSSQELYYLPDDPGEENDLIGEEEDKYRELNSLLMLHQQEAGRVPWQRPAAEENETNYGGD